MIIRRASMLFPLHNVCLATTLLIATIYKFTDSTEATKSHSRLNQDYPRAQIRIGISTKVSQQFVTQRVHEQSNGDSSRRIARSTLEDASVLEYLQKYGYMNKKASSKNNENLVSEESFTSAIRSFQRFAGINDTGFIDRETSELMQMPRCGNLDSYETSASNNNKLHRPPPILPKIGADWRRQSERYEAKTIRRRKRYALQGSKWRRQELTYRISQYPTRFLGKKHEVDGQIERAFGLWSRVAPIDFIVKKDGRVHIDIRFASGEHGDGDAFDGPGNTLAHAYFPQYGGDAHFDDQEYWTIDSYTGTNIFQVAAHELGHSLGLGHSNVREALMAPFYQKYKPNFKLHLDDILAIQALYGEKRLLNTPGSELASTHPIEPGSSSPTTTTLAPAPNDTPLEDPAKRGRGGGATTGNKETSDDDEMPLFPDLAGNGIGASGGGDDALAFEGAGTTITTTTTTSTSVAGPNNRTPSPDLCQDSQIDTATRTEDGNSYVFKGNFYWQLTSEGIARGFPRRIAADWDGLPGSLDASFTWADGKTFFFKGNKYWRFRNKRREIGYPKLISAGFAGIPDDLDAAFVWSGNGRTYMFKGAQYWRYDSKADPPVSSEYPRSVKIWRGVPAYLNAALKWENNVTYFFKGQQYYRFNDKEFRVEGRSRPGFPRPSAEWWFGCIGDNNLAVQRAMLAQYNGNLNYRNSFSREHENIPDLIMDSNRPGAAGPVTTRDEEWASIFPARGAAASPSMGTHINDHSDPSSSIVNFEGPEAADSLGLAEATTPASGRGRDRDSPPTWQTQSGDSQVSRNTRQFHFPNPFAPPSSTSSSSSSKSAIFSHIISLTTSALMMMSTRHYYF